MTRPAKRERASHPRVVAAAKAAPGQWVRVRPYRMRGDARMVGAQLVGARDRYLMYGPAGSFEARLLDVGDETELSVRYIGPAAGGAR